MKVFNRTICKSNFYQYKYDGCIPFRKKDLVMYKRNSLVNKWTRDRWYEDNVLHPKITARSHDKQRLNSNIYGVYSAKAFHIRKIANPDNHKIYSVNGNLFNFFMPKFSFKLFIASFLKPEEDITKMPW